MFELIDEVESIVWGETRKVCFTGGNTDRLLAALDDGNSFMLGFNPGPVGYSYNVDIQIPAILCPVFARIIRKERER